MSDCRRFEKATRREEPREWRALEAHAGECSECGRRLAIWNAISRDASALRRTWETPSLWPRIEAAMTAQGPNRSSEIAAPAASARARVPWLPLAAAAALFALAMIGLQVFRPRLGEREFLNAHNHKDPLLTEQALTDVQKSERRYEASIEELSRLAEPALKEPATPLLVSYREKILLLDGAISDLRTQLDQNQFNTHLRHELLAMYQEKQRTLQQVIQEGKS